MLSDSRITFDGVTIVVSPLISLMKDQVGSLVQSGVPAAYINSSLSYPQFLRVLSNVEHGKYKIIYVAPERLLTDGFLDTCKKIKISMVAVDEAHCVSQWGQDFRPSYLKIISFVESLANRPIVGAFTATATNDVKEDIKKILRLENPFEITTGFDRPNLFFGVIKSSSKDEKLIDLIRERGDRSGIVYCATRKMLNLSANCSAITAFRRQDTMQVLMSTNAGKIRRILFLTEKILWLQPMLSVWELTSQMLHM